MFDWGRGELNGCAGADVTGGREGERHLGSWAQMGECVESHAVWRD